MVIIMDNKNFNLEGPLEENEKSSKDKIVEDVKLLFQDVKNTKNDIDKNKFYEKLDLALRIVLGLVSLAICGLSVIDMIAGGSFEIARGDYVSADGPLLFSVPFAVVGFVCSMILFFCKKTSVYKITTAILLLFLLVMVVEFLIFFGVL